MYIVLKPISVGVMKTQCYILYFVSTKMTISCAK